MIRPLKETILECVPFHCATDAADFYLASISIFVLFTAQRPKASLAMAQWSQRCRMFISLALGMSKNCRFQRTVIIKYKHSVTVAQKTAPMFEHISD